MTPDKLRGFIASLRSWLDQFGVPLLPKEQASVVDGWRNDALAAEALLEVKPELPIAFLGPSQQGKSSLINALLGENILAVGGAVGACTCVITSAHYRAGSGFGAEIDFISLQDWKKELQALRQALSAPPSAEDSDTDREEWEAGQKAAQEKLAAVYGDGAANDLDRFLADDRLGLPGEVAEAMLSTRAITMEEESAVTLRNRVRRYLVGREQHADAQFWPLISRVRIYGDFKVLANGVVLVDLPGLNDPNPAREQVTNTYLNEARYIWLICNSQTGIDRVFTEILRDNALLFRLFLEGRLDAFSVITTRVDDINLEAVLSQMGVDVDTFDGNHAAPLEFRRQEIASYVQEHLLSIAEDIVAKSEAPEHKEAFLQRVRSTPVFSISTSAYCMRRTACHYIGGCRCLQRKLMFLVSSNICTPLLLNGATRHKWRRRHDGSRFCTAQSAVFF